MNGYQIISEALKIQSNLYILDNNKWNFLVQINNYESGSETYFFKFKNIALKLFMDKHSAVSSHNLQKKASNYKLAPKIMKYKSFDGVNKFKLETESLSKISTTKNNRLRVNQKELIGFGYFTEVADLINSKNKYLMIQQLPELKEKLIKYKFSVKDLGMSNLGIIKSDVLVVIDFSPKSQKESVL